MGQVGEVRKPLEAMLVAFAVPALVLLILVCKELEVTVWQVFVVGAVEEVGVTMEEGPRVHVDLQEVVLVTLVGLLCEMFKV